MIGDLVFHKALCDLGASINLMPLSVCKKLGLGEPKRTKMSFQLADISIKETPLILRRPFRATGKAVIDVHEGKLRLRVGEEEITLNDAINDPLETTLTLN
ncbi:uncharacterized protein [Primulina huaijiensis]|uniref:uncharacterized protein n=1 Tax=Primulina huaijiensis TaxID=1492673 RepID=UPI003CC78AE8